jgi:hypothetical protein
MKAPNMNPMRKPPVGPNIIPRPELPPEKTGRPAIPRSRYTITLIVPHLAPNIAPVSNTKKVCNVIGTGLAGMGISTYAPTAIKAAKREAKTIFLMLLLFVV